MHSGQRTRVAGELQTALVDMVVVDMCVAEGVDKVAILETCCLRNHHSEESVAGDVEGDAEEYVGRALVELARESSVGDIELEEDVAGRQSHTVDLANVPSRNQQAARVGIGLYLLDELGDLVDMAAVGATPRAPLAAVDGTEVAVGVGPFVPDGHLVVVKILDIGVATEEPEEFVYD